MSCIITYKGKSYSEAEFKTFLENNYKDVVDSLYSDKVPANFTNHSGRASNNKDGVFRLNKDQEKAYKEIIDFIDDPRRETHSLVGYAGTGKTTLINEIIKEVKGQYNIILTSPTNRANSVIESKVNKGQTVLTLHQMLGLSPDMDLTTSNFDVRDVKYTLKDKSISESIVLGSNLIIVDESSMINDSLYNLILHTIFDEGGENNKILFIGDSAQIKPVKQDTLSLALNSEKTSHLTIVERAENNSILKESMYVRNEGDFTYENNMNEKGEGVKFYNDGKEFINSVVEMFKSDEFKKDPLFLRVIAGTNSMVDRLNKAVKEKIYGNTDGFNVGEVVTGYSNWGRTSDRKPSVRNGGDYIINSISKGSTISIGPNKNSVNIETENILLKDLITGKETVVPMLKIKDKEHLEKIGKLIEDLRLETIEEAKVIGKKAWVKYFSVVNSFATPEPITYQGRRIVDKTFATGFAHTIHKSQGGTYKNIAIEETSLNSFQDQELVKQLKYVAVTRAESGAHIFTNENIKEGNTVEQKSVQEAVQETPKAPPSLSSLLSSGLFTQHSENFESPREDMFDYPNIKNCN